MLKTVVLVSLLFAVSCSSPQQSSHKIQLLLDWKTQMEHAGFLVAQEKGFYAKKGLEVEILSGKGAPTTARLVGNATYVLGVSSGSATVMARAKGIPVVSVAVINQHSPVVVYSLKESNLTEPGDLVGKRIGVNIGGTKHREFQAFLRHEGISETSIQLMGMSESNPGPLLAGQVDAMLGYTEDQPVTVELRGREVNRISLASYGIDLYSTNVIVNETYMTNSPEVVRAFVQASIEGWAYAIANPDEAVSIYTGAFPESNLRFNQANFAKLIPILQSKDVDAFGLGSQTSERWTHTQDVLFDLELIEKKGPISGVFSNQFLGANH
jgi:NitT/TauT family transport system substrate-binding protein